MWRDSRRRDSGDTACAPSSARGLSVSGAALTSPQTCGFKQQKSTLPQAWMWRVQDPGGAGLCPLWRLPGRLLPASFCSWWPWAALVPQSLPPSSPASPHVSSLTKTPVGGLRVDPRPGRSHLETLTLITSAETLSPKKAASTGPGHTCFGGSHCPAAVRSPQVHTLGPPLILSTHWIPLDPPAPQHRALLAYSRHLICARGTPTEAATGPRVLGPGARCPGAPRGQRAERRLYGPQSTVIYNKLWAPPLVSKAEGLPGCFCKRRRKKVRS